MPPTPLECPPLPAGVPAVTLEGIRLHELWQLAWLQGHGEGWEQGLAEGWQLREPPLPDAPPSS